MLLARAAPRALRLATAAATATAAAACASEASSSNRRPDDQQTATAVSELHNSVKQMRGWEAMERFYGSAERILIGYLGMSADKDRRLNPQAAEGLIAKTLAYRDEHDLDRQDVLRDIESARCRSHWPYAFADAAPDGSPVEVCRLSRLSVPRILADFPEDEVVDFFALWCEQTLRLYGAGVRAGRGTKGSYHVYDCRDVRWKTLLYDVRTHWATVRRVINVGQSHWPDLSNKYFVIHAPYMATFLWKVVTPLINEHTRHKVSFDGGVPAELLQAVGGEEAVERMLECSPHVTRRASDGQQQFAG